MTNAIGTQFENRVVNFFRDGGFPEVRRIGKPGGYQDSGDIEGFPAILSRYKTGVVLGAKAHTTIRLADGMDSLERAADFWLADNERLGYERALAWQIWNRKSYPDGRNYAVCELGTLLSVIQLLNGRATQ